jgi:hypothetical protein
MISVEEFVERVVRLGADRGPRGFPRGARDREILLKSIALGLDEKRSYSEREVNEILKRWKREVAPALACDHVTLRRWLVDYGHLERTRDGSKYRLGFPANSVAFDVEIYDVDLPATVAAFLAERERKAAERRARRGALLQDGEHGAARNGAPHEE